jgi:phage-related minor tail protein
VATNDVGIRVGVDGEKQFRDSMKGINSQLKNLNTEMQASTREFEKNADSQEALNRKAEILGKTIDTEKQKIELLTKQYETQNKKLFALGEELDKVSKEFGENSEQAGKAQNAYNRQATEVNNLGSQLNAAKSDLSRFEEEMQQTVIQSDKLVSGLKNASDRLEKFSSKASSIGNTLTLGVTVPLLGVGAAAVKTGNDFEAQMSRVKAIAGASSSEIKKLDDLALQLGASTSFSASEVAQGMENLASAGFTVEEIISAMPGMLDLAASSGADLATASDIAASSIRGFGLDAEDAAHVADVFAEAAARTNAQTEDMGEAMKYIAPVANAMGQNIEEVAAAVGIMSDAGIKGSQAGTSLRGALSRLAKPTEKMYEKMDELGLSFYDASGNMLPLNEMI